MPSLKLSVLDAFDAVGTKAKKTFEQLRPPSAHQPGEAQNFPRLNLEADIGEEPG